MGIRNCRKSSHKIRLRLDRSSRTRHSSSDVTISNRLSKTCSLAAMLA
uniref:Uncharacterized protein n=1 Tax=Daphnia magna TaxID=35525 RepID=A0A0P5UXW8_9CRUS